MNEFFMTALYCALPVMCVLAIFFLVMQWVDKKASKDVKEANEFNDLNEGFDFVSKANQEELLKTEQEAFELINHLDVDEYNDINN